LRAAGKAVWRIGELEVATTPARFLGDLVGLVFQDPDSQLVMSRADDEVAFGLENRGWPRPEMEARVPEALAQAGLAGFGPRATNTLSGGEKQRLAIADILAARPSLLVFDEPTANLDPPGMYDTLEQIAALARRRENTIVLIEHRLEAALPLADDVLLLDDAGQQLAFARPGPSGRRRWQCSIDAAPGFRGRGKEPVRGVPAAAAGARTRATLGPEVLARVAEVGVNYRADGSGAQPALDGVSLDARAGERIAIVGPNGAGKSTLLFVIAGLKRPDRGAVG